MNPSDTGGPAAEIPSNSWWSVAQTAVKGIADYRMAKIQASSNAAQVNAAPGTVGPNASAAMTPGAGARPMGVELSTRNMVLLALAAALGVVLVMRLAKG